jgi:hypothetical protein
MPKFIKMGLNGTGFLGKKESHERAKNRRLLRRKILPGFPVTTPFGSIKEVREYLSGDRITCLLCGKSYKKLGAHLRRIHGLTPDGYKEQFKIPWTYSLACEDTKDKHRRLLAARMEQCESWGMPKSDMWKLYEASKRSCPHKAEIGTNNLGNYAAPKYPLVKLSNGSFVTKSEAIRLMTSRKGTKEYKLKMRARPQCQPEAAGARFGAYWRGRKQSPEHIAKRFASKRSK